MSNNKQNDTFESEFLTYNLRNGFGVLQKREIDILVLYLMMKYKIDLLAKRSLPISTQIKSLVKDGVNILQIASSITTLIGIKK